MRFAGFIFILVLIFSCENRKEEVVTFNELNPVKVIKKKKQKEIDTVLVVLHPENELGQFVDTLFPDFQWMKLDTVLFIDRFGARSSEKWIGKNDKDSITLLTYGFKDSLTVKNAFFNWLDCFGNNCKQVKIGSNVKIKKRNLQLFVGEKKLIYLESNTRLKSQLVRSSLCADTINENWLYHIDSPKTGKTSWSKLLRGKKQIIKATL